MKSKTILIDGDSICYMCSKETLEESIAAADKLVKHMFDRTKATEFIMFLSKGPYYRHSINPDYKGQRKPSPLLWLKTLKGYLIERYSAIALPEIEADDAVAYYKTLDPTAQICAIDKDVLKQVPGTHYNYYHRKFVTTTEEEAHKWMWLQALMGDPGDNIKGIKGVGPAKAEKVLAEYEPKKYKYAVLSEYCKVYGEIIGVKKFYDNFYQVYLLRTEEEIGQFVKDLPIVEPKKIEYEEEEKW
tara:strand:- start:3065 stop:3796 length:732 start_codon:yes stop_codon:yes gene_type:complete